ncbi:MAG: hypothetical protein JW910_04675 [Anaerolineae bacterium]|nr:hypothetical protein [Anaerolineae bacterium]
MQSFTWHRLEAASTLYRYQPHLGAVSAPAGHVPVLLVHPLPPETGSALAAMFYADGLTELYTHQVRGVDDAAADELARVVEVLLAAHPGQVRVVLVGCAAGGTLARRYLLQGGFSRTAYLFTLGSAHRYSPLICLRDSVVEPYAVPVDLPELCGTSFDGTVIVNLYSETMRQDPDEPGFGMLLPEAINVGVPLPQEALCRHAATYRVLRQHLAGQYWLVAVRLQGLTMRGPASDDRTGPFCFEVNGQRVPFDGVFSVPVDEPFAFDPAMTPLGTLTFPLTQWGRAADIDFRLKDLAPRRGPRRKLLTSLHVALGPDTVSEHVLQDSQGSEIRIQVRCDRPPSLIEAEPT